MHEYHQIAINNAVFINQQEVCSSCKGVSRTLVAQSDYMLAQGNVMFCKPTCIKCAIKHGILHAYYGRVQLRVINEALMMYYSLRLKSITKGDFKINDPRAYTFAISSIDESNVGMTRNVNQTTSISVFNDKQEVLVDRTYSDLEMNVVYGVIETMLKADIINMGYGHIEVGCPNCLKAMKVRKMSDSFTKDRRIFNCLNSKCAENLRSKVVYELTSDGLTKKKLLGTLKE